VGYKGLMGLEEIEDQKRNRLTVLTYKTKMIFAAWKQIAHRRRLWKQKVAKALEHYRQKLQRMGFRTFRNNTVLNVYLREKQKQQRHKILYQSFMKLVCNVEKTKQKIVGLKEFVMHREMKIVTK
jgi:hypothetical protein